MKILNLFAGHQTWLKPFREAGHQTWATDILPLEGIDCVKDVLELTESDFPAWAQEADLLVASPDCTAFSVASIGTHWTGGPRGYIPKTKTAANRMSLVVMTKEIIEYLQPANFIIENPRGMLRKLGLLDEFERRTVWYCHYGDDRAKPTDLWGGFPEAFKVRGECHNQRADHPAWCCCRDHPSTPRGCHTAGTQNIADKAARSFIPYELACDLLRAVEQETT